MRILHTSDWHLGISLGRRRLIDLQAGMLASLLTVIDRERVDVLVLAGDIYDQSVPPLEAIELFDAFVASTCLERGIPLIAIAGNHDSPERLSQYAPLLNKTGFFISGRIAERQVIRYQDVCFHLFPYFHTAEVRRLFPDEGIASTEDAMRALVRHSLEDFPERLQLCRPFVGHRAEKSARPGGELGTEQACRHVALAHCFTQNAEPSGTDRMAELSVGGSSRIAASVFDGFDQVFLGHLHRRQSPLKNVSYSGSPAHYAFSEIGQKKGVQIYDTETDSLTFHELDNTVQLVERTGSYEELCRAATERTDVQVEERGANGGADRSEGPPVRQLMRLVLTDKAATLERLDHLRKLYPDLLALESTAQRLTHRGGIERTFDEQTLLSKPEEILAAFYQEVEGKALTDFQKEIFQRAWEQAEEDNG